jgi:hypothetical protein
MTQSRLRAIITRTLSGYGDGKPTVAWGGDGDPNKPNLITLVGGHYQARADVEHALRNYLDEVSNNPTSKRLRVRY